MLCDDYTTSVTLEFVREFLPETDQLKLIDVGCGDGALCFHLAESGYQPFGIDVDSNLLKNLRLAGIPVWGGNWCEFQPIAVNAIIFNRSLHHLDPVTDAIARAAECLPDGGRIIVEDFAFDDVDSAGLGWMIKQAKALSERDVLRPVANSLLGRIVTAADAETEWHHDHHDVVSASEMHTCLSESGRVIHSTDCPYLFRYFANSLVATDVDGILQSLYRSEEQLIDSGQSRSVGRRWVVDVERR